MIKIYAILGALVLAFSLGFFTCHKFNEAALQKETAHRLKDVSKGTTKIIQFNSEYDNALGKDDCSGRDMPVALRKLLK